jgi:hypothetical protein
MVTSWPASLHSVLSLQPQHEPAECGAHHDPDDVAVAVAFVGVADVQRDQPDDAVGGRVLGAHVIATYGHQS